MTLGTILPTAKSERATSAYVMHVRAAQALTAKTLAQFDRRVEYGETRYYDGANRFAVINRSGSVLWFRIADNGDQFPEKS